MKFQVTGMSCAACSARVEKAVAAVPGVSSVSVNLLTGTMLTEGTASPESIVSAVVAAGYGASSDEIKTEAPEASEQNESRVLLKRLLVSLGFLLLLMYVSMGHMMFGFPLPRFLSGNILSIALAELILSSIVLLINRKFFINGWKGIINKAPNMDTLVATGSGASFVYSIISMFLMNNAAAQGKMEAASSYSDGLFFESAAMILVLITVGKTLEAYSKGKTTSALKELLALAPDTALIETQDGEKEIPSSELKIGDIFILKPGSSVPADGVILEGASSFNQSSVTGESVPVDKSAGDSVISGTINCDGFVRCRAEKVGSETSLSKIVQMVSDATAGKAPISRLADKVAGVFVPVVISIALVTFIIWLLTGENPGFALSRGISVLVISCPCALGLATPVAIMVGSGMGAKKGILFKTAASLEAAGEIETIAFDKTGTVTEGIPEVKEIYTEGISQKMLLTYAASLEVLSEHPLARAVVKRAEDDQLTLLACSDFAAEPGMGICGTVGSKRICGGSERFIRTKLNNPEKMLHGETGIVICARTPLYFSIDGEYAGLITVSDTVRSNATSAVTQLKNMGINTVMITGDGEESALYVQKATGIDTTFFGVLPGDKAALVKAISLQGKTAMVGDGINDAPALTSADVGIAIGAGTDIAIDSADVVLMNSSAVDVPAAIRLGRLTLRTIKQNLFWAFFYNCIGIPIAAGVLIKPFGIQLNPMIAAACMSISSIFVVTNALRLGTKDIYSTRYDRKIKKNNKIKEFNIMTKTIKVEGMMCPHCEARVRDTLKGIQGVLTANVDYKTGEAVVAFGSDISDEVFKSEIEKQGYKVLSIA